MKDFTICKIAISAIKYAHSAYTDHQPVVNAKALFIPIIFSKSRTDNPRNKAINPCIKEIILYPAII